jgi:hypothetical protein
MSSLDRDKLPSSESALIDISGRSTTDDVNQVVTELTPTEQLCLNSNSASSSNLVLLCYYLKIATSIHCPEHHTIIFVLQ